MRKFRNRNSPRGMGSGMRGGMGNGMRGGMGNGMRGDANSGKRRMFTKLMKDDTATVDNIFQAERFLEGMETFASKFELIQELTDNRKLGMKRIRDVLSLTSSSNDVELLLVPLLGHVMNSETNRPTYRPMLNRILHAIYEVPGLMETLAINTIIEELSQESASRVCSFLMEIVKAYAEPRKSEAILELAKQLDLRGDVEQAGLICSFLRTDQDISKLEVPNSKAASTKVATSACWITDTIPPGGRHSNDEFNFRNIKVIPTADELCCTTKPYLPLASGENNIIQNDPVARLLDRNFRLIREDAVASMRTKIAESKTKTTWENARIIDFVADNTAGPWEVSFVIQFDRRRGGNTNWKRSRALMPGSVVSLCSEGKPVRMGVINIREDKWLASPDGPKIGVIIKNTEDFNNSIEELVFNQPIAQKLEKLASSKGRNHQALLLKQQFKSYDLEEVSKSFFAYQPILETLQTMESVPLSGVLCGADDGNPRKPPYLPIQVQLPSEKTFRGYKIDLRTMDIDGIVRNTTLDTSQAKALLHAMTERVSLVQGPPGCGKTFIGALIARVIRDNTDESIMCVCYTNHALDQFLEHMLDYGEKSLVRIGGRSKSERLSGYQLKELVKKNSSRSDPLQRKIRQTIAELHKIKEEIELVKNSLASPVPWKHQGGGGMKDFLRYGEPEIYKCLQVPGLGEDGFEIIGPKKKKIGDGFLWKCWENGDRFPNWMVAHLDGNQPGIFQWFWSMPLTERRVMIDRWRRELMEPSLSEMDRLVKHFQELTKVKQGLNQDSDLDVLKNARIIGATTSGAAKYHDILSENAAGVVIVEEAGEVLEGHILASLTSGTKHLIMIGDHKQLRPKVESYELTTTSGCGYNLDCSLFERLVLEGQPSVALEVQHRMRPSISALIRNQTYPHLKDHESVSKLPNVMGLSENLVFIDHQYAEDKVGDESTSRSNEQEAEIVIEIIRFFLLQGYRTDQLVVLTPYLGQLITILGMMKSNLKEVTALVGERDAEDLENLDEEKFPLENVTTSASEKNVRVSSVDNFQGEEADVVIISLVRSNPRGGIGFLKEEQRVNVLLSRARHGMVIIGNSTTLKTSKKGNATWEPILDLLERDGHIKEGLPTVCQLHPEDDPILLKTPAEFKQARPNGGCCRPCKYRLGCGHVCPMMCHPFDRDHKRAELLCIQPCRRVPPGCKHDHACPKPCNVNCGPCCARVPPIKLNCDHVYENPLCHETSSEEELKKLGLKCKVRVTHKFSECGHEVEISCGKSKQENPYCPVICGVKLDCGHPCMKICGSCDKKNHSCQKACGRMLFCGHTCGRPCHEPSPCDPCGKQCVSKCTHSTCALECCIPCHSCVEPCDWECKHQGRCNLVCGAPCSRLPCNMRCEKKLSCGHQCPSICGEICPNKSFCQICGIDRVKSQIVDMILCSSYEDHDVNEDPVLFLPCGHFYSVSTLDHHLEMTKVYKMMGNQFLGLEPLRGNDIGEKPKVCIDCRAPIHSLRRYGRFLRLTELRSLERKHMMHVQQRLKEASQKATKVKALKFLQNVEREIRRSPMRVVFEACVGFNEVGAYSPPPSAPLIECLKMMAQLWGEAANSFDDKAFMNAIKVYNEAIEIADTSESTRSGGILRLALSKLYVKCCPADTSKVIKEVEHLLTWIIGHCFKFHDLVNDATNLKMQLKRSIGINELRQVISAMSVISGYNYGGSASDHWYECPNGHPYYIGECGGAMETATCPECGEQVGGRSHALLGSNRRAGGRLMEALNRT